MIMFILDMNEVNRRAKFQADSFADIWQVLSDITLPIISYFSGFGMNNCLREMYRSPQKKRERKEIQIEDALIKFCCITTDTTAGKMVVHETGPLWKFVRASMSLLNLFPPMYDNGHLLVDGGYVNNLPIDVVHALGAQYVIAVDVESKDNTAFENVYPYGDSLSGFRIAGNKLLSLFGFTKPYNIPRVADHSVSLFFIASTMRLQKMIDEGERSGKLLYLRPDIQVKYHIVI